MAVLIAFYIKLLYNLERDFPKERNLKYIRMKGNTIMDENRYRSLGPGFEPYNPTEKKGIPLPILLFLIASLVLAGISMNRFPESLSEYKVYRSAEERTHSGETAAALQDLLEVLEEHPNSLPVTLELMDLSMESGYYDQAAYVFNEYLVGKGLSDGQYARMMHHSRRLDKYYLTYDSIDSLMAEAEMAVGQDASEEALEEQAEWLRSEISALHGDVDQDQAFLYYYDAMLALTQEEQYDFLKKAYEEDPELFDVRVLLANAERSAGNFTEAHEHLNMALSKESEDVGAHRGLAVLDMLEGKPEEALSHAEQAYDLGPDELYVRDTYLVALHVNEHKEEEQAMIEEIEDLEGELEEDTRQLLDGEMSLQDYYMGD